MLDHAGFATGIRGLGPGTRVVLWVRGCHIGCKGCMSKDLWPRGIATPIEPLATALVDALSGHDGLTISGGEPFEQPEALARLIDLVRASADVQVLCYSGYPLKALRRMVSARPLLSIIDLLVDGPFVEAATNERVWRGSDNQRLHILSHRTSGTEDAEAESGQRELQVQPLGPGRVRVIGIPRRGDLLKIAQALEATGMMIEGR